MTNSAVKIRTDSDNLMCPFNFVPFGAIPGYTSGYGCPLCKGLSYHIELSARDIDTQGNDDSRNHYDHG